MKNIKLSESKLSKVPKMTKNTSKERDRFSNSNVFTDIRSSVYRSLELDTTSVFNDSSNSSEILSDSGISDSCIPENRTETIDMLSVPSTYENNLSSSFSISMPYIFTQLNSNCSLKPVDHDSKELKDGDSAVFTCTKNNCFNISERENSDNDENSKKSLFCVFYGGKETCSFNFLSEEKSLNSEPNIFSSKSVEGSGKKHICSHCLKSFRYPSKLKRHINTHKIKQNDSDADDSKKSLGSNSMIDKRIDLNCETSDFHKNMLHRQKSAQCPDCLKSFKSPSKLLRHIKTHVGLKSYVCHVCSKAFLEKFNLRAHLRIHRDEQSYVCEICERAFNIKSNLNRHMQTHMREQQFTCSKCGKECRSEKKLAIHFRIHDEIAHTCPECGRVFKKKSNLKRHVRIHYKEKMAFM